MIIDISDISPCLEHSGNPEGFIHCFDIENDEIKIEFWQGVDIFFIPIDGIGNTLNSTCETDSRKIELAVREIREKAIVATWRRCDEYGGSGNAKSGFFRIESEGGG